MKAVCILTLDNCYVCVYTDSMNKALDFVFKYSPPPTELLLLLFDLGYRPASPKVEPLSPEDQKLFDEAVAEMDFNDKYKY